MMLLRSLEKRLPTRNPMLLSLPLAACFLSYSLSGFAGDTALYGGSARSETTQAFTAIADDPSAIFYNPAGITQVKGSQIDATLAFIAPNVHYTNSTTGAVTHNAQTSLGSNIYATTDLAAPATLGIGVYAANARMSNNEISAATANMIQDGRLLRMNVAPTAAFNILPDLAVGGSVIFSRVMFGTDVLGLNQFGTGTGVGGQVGLLAHLPYHLRFGLNYITPMTVTINGNGTLVNVGTGHFTTDMQFPSVISTGLSWQVTPPILLAVGYDHEQWNQQTLTMNYYDNAVINGIASQALNFHHSNNYRAGVIYRPMTEHEFRAGYMYTQASLPASVIIPAHSDFNTNVGTLGYSYYWHKWRFDAGYEYCHLNTANGTQALFPGVYRGHVQLFMAGVNYQLA